MAYFCDEGPDDQSDSGGRSEAIRPGGAGLDGGADNRSQSAIHRRGVASVPATIASKRIRSSRIREAAVKAEQEPERVVRHDWDADYIWGNWADWPTPAKWIWRWQHFWRPAKNPYPVGHPKYQGRQS